MSTVPSLPFWDSQMVGPDAFKPASMVRTPTDPGRPIVPGELVLLSPSAPISVSLPDPRRSPGRMIAFTSDENYQPITFVAYPGTTIHDGIHGGPSWAWGTNLSYAGITFVSIGSEWRAIGRFPGV